MRAAAAIWPGMRPALVDPGIERSGGPAQRLQPHRRRTDGRAPEQLGVVHQERQHRRLGLGAVDEGDALLGREAERREPGARSAARPRPPLGEPPLAHQRQRDVARGARSPLAPTLPCSGTAGTMPVLMSATRASTRLGSHTAGRAEQHVGPEHHHGAHHVGRHQRSPTPAAWLRIRFTCSCSSWSGAMRTLASFPNPVLMP